MPNSTARAMRGGADGDVNEYAVTVRDLAGERIVLVTAATAAQARARIEAEPAIDVIAVRFVRATGFGCQVRVR